MNVCLWAGESLRYCPWLAHTRFNRPGAAGLLVQLARLLAYPSCSICLPACLPAHGLALHLATASSIGHVVCQLYFEAHSSDACQTNRQKRAATAAAARSWRSRAGVHSHIGLSILGGHLLITQSILYSLLPTPPTHHIACLLSPCPHPHLLFTLVSHAASRSLSSHSCRPLLLSRHAWEHSSLLVGPSWWSV